MVYYVGDPCYIIPDEEWDEFCNLMFGKRNPSIYDHLDCVINWKGQKIEIWSNGGDGTWTFDGVKTTNGANSFGVDAGIFCVIDLEKLPDTPRMDASRVGMLFDKKPDLYVEDGIVYINDIHDNSMADCWQCGELVYCDNADWECENGECVGCENCFECECDEE